MSIGFRLTLILGMALALGLSNSAYAQSENAQKIVPIILGLFLDDEVTFPAEAIVNIGEDNQLNAFVGRDIDTAIVITENGID